MITAEELIEQAGKIDMQDATAAARWCDAVRRCLGAQNIGGDGFYTSVAFTFDAVWSSAEMRLAYMLGRIESDVFEWCRSGHRRAIRGQRLRNTRIHKEIIPPDEYKARVAAYGHRLKLAGKKNFRRLTAAKFKETEKYVYRWTRLYPPKKD